MKDVNYKMMHKDALASLESLEQLMSTVRKLAELSTSYMSDDDMDEVEEEAQDGNGMMEDSKLYGRSEVIADVSHRTNAVERAPKEERKKLAIIKLGKM